MTNAWIVTFVCLAAATTASAQLAPLTWGDQGNGTYQNPILKADYSDPDVIRVGSDFYLVASDFHFVGIQVLHSKDLVNWRIIGQVFHRLAMSPKYDQMKGYGQGTWAPSLRYHNGEFYLYVCTPHEGLFMWHTKNPAGPWSKMVTVKKVNGWEDPCPFWDDDGKAYLIHSHVGAGPLLIARMSQDGTHLLDDDGKVIYRGLGAEGPKLYKRHGFYYVSFPEGGVSAGGQVVIRSRNIFGPYQRRQVFPNRSPHQGGLVELKNGQWWFISFKSTGYLGRICYLNPVTWTQDDWPVFGDHGKPVQVWKKPDVGATYPIARPRTSDEFNSPDLAPQWQWNHNPVNSAWSLTQRPGFLRLRALPADKLADAHNTLTQKLWDSAGVMEVKLDPAHMSDGQRAGLTLFSGTTFGWIGVWQSAGTRRIAWTNGARPVVTGGAVYLRGIDDGPIGHFSYSLDGKTFTPVDSSITMRFADWKGGRVGIFSYGPGNGAADFDYFHYRYADRLDHVQGVSPAPQ
jgi:beta-xylosidase